MNYKSIYTCNIANWYYLIVPCTYIQNKVKLGEQVWSCFGLSHVHDESETWIVQAGPVCWGGCRAVGRVCSQQWVSGSQVELRRLSRGWTLDTDHQWSGHVMTTRVTSDPKSAKIDAMCVTMTGMLKNYYKHCKSSRVNTLWSETVVGVLEELKCPFRGSLVQD